MHRFLPDYPEKSSSAAKLLGNIAAKKEFQAAHLKDEKLYPQQKFVARFMSPYTKYDELLLFHEMGSGKTQSAIVVAESLMTNPNSGIVKTVVIVRGKGLGQNFVNELVNSTDGKYIGDNVRLWKRYYEIWTMEVFGKTLNKLSDTDLVKQYNHRLFIIDEAHHLKKKPQGPYNPIHRLLHLLPHRKVLLLTGTPMKDDVSEFSNCANLMLSLENQLPFGVDFNQTYFKGDKLSHKKSLRNKLAGLVSFYRGTGPDVEKVFKGSIVHPMKHIPVVMCSMHPFQELYYRQANQRDLEASAIYIHSRQASLFVFPDGSYGRTGFKRYINVVKRQSVIGKSLTVYRLTLALEQALKIDLHRYSAKYHHVLSTVTSPAAPKTFIHTEFVHGGGAILLGEILKLHGYHQATGKETSPGKRFILATTHSAGSHIMDLIQRFNEPDNDDGHIIQIFIGSQVVSEGYSLKNVAVEFILTPHWNFSETEQIIARCWRINSHTVPGRKLEVNLLAVALQPDKSIRNGQENAFDLYGIDMYMYTTAENKDFRIKQMERLLKELAVDCHNHTPLVNAQDWSRDCDYTTCTIRCHHKQSEVDQASYHILYPPTEKLVALVEKLFLNESAVPIDRVLAEAKLPQIVTLLFLAEYLFGNIPLWIKGGMRFLRKTGNILYVTPDPSTPVDVFMKLLPLCDQSITTHELLQSMEKNWLVRSVKQLFAKPTLAKHILDKLPHDFQHLLLTACLYADSIGINKDIIDTVLDYYTGFYKKGKNIYVWLFYEKFGTLVLRVDKETATWKKAPRDIFQEIRDKMYASPVGYYGLYNPRLNEFCLRKVTTTTETDLRRVNVGRRCDDWDQKSLIAIIQNKLGLQLDLANHNRSELCAIIQRELWARNLVLYNFDCGNQFKIRGRV